MFYADIDTGLVYLACEVVAWVFIVLGKIGSRVDGGWRDALFKGELKRMVLRWERITTRLVAVEISSPRDWEKEAPAPVAQSLHQIHKMKCPFSDCPRIVEAV